jgi:hypothetical protein
MRKRLYIGLSLVVLAASAGSYFGMVGGEHSHLITSEGTRKPMTVSNFVGVDGVKNRAQIVSAKFSQMNTLAYETALACVERLGIAVPPTARSSNSGALLRGGVSIATQADIDDRTVNGYRTWMTSKEREAATPSQTPDSQEFASAMNGDPLADLYHASNGFVVATTGCLAEARVAVFGSIETFAQIQLTIDSLAGKVQAKILSSEVMLKTQQEWSACMAKSGYDIASWFDMSDLLRQFIDYKNDSLEAVKAKDMAIAKADANCLNEARYVANLSSLPDQAEDEVLSNEPDVVASLEAELSKVPDQ